MDGCPHWGYGKPGEKTGMKPAHGKSIGLRRGGGAPAGFTLLELLVALTVASVAAAVFVSMFSACIGLSRANGNMAAAAELAETQLAAILRAPHDFVWDNSGGTARIPLATHEKEPPGGYPVQPPAVTLVTREAQQRLAARYGQFRWAAFAELSAPDAAAYEVTVVIRWMDAGRPQTLTLTSAIARALVDTPAAAVSAPAVAVPVSGARGAVT
jgi:prepilin-type N-terminal cleavage/methylation domain-containing protein